jgi:hypothetical protein
MTTPRLLKSCGRPALVRRAAGRVGLQHWCGWTGRGRDKVTAAPPGASRACTLPIACCPAILAPHAPSVKVHCRCLGWGRAPVGTHLDRGSGAAVQAWCCVQCDVSS